jgi:hypothetical protein
MISTLHIAAGVPQNLHLASNYPSRALKLGGGVAAQTHELASAANHIKLLAIRT